MAADVHVYPVEDVFEHDTESRGCWCQPDVHDECGTTLVIHHSADGRERSEPDAPPSVWRH